MSKKLRIEFEGFEEVIQRLSSLEGNIKKTTENALKSAHKYVTKNAEEAIRPHRDTGQTEESLIKEAKVEWVGTVASIPTGFSIRRGGLASIMLMYGTPRMQKDQKLYNAFFGRKTQKQIQEIEAEHYYQEIRRLNG